MPASSYMGITTTVPVEIVYAAGYQPVDLNNVFITSASAQSWIEQAQKAGFPRNTCNWIKGLYSARQAIACPRVIAVTAGDCSNTHALMEIWQEDQVTTYPFAYPFPPNRQRLEQELQQLAHSLGTTLEAAQQQKQRLDTIRARAWEVDRLTWQTNQVSGEENHLYLVNTSDFNSQPDTYAAEADTFLHQAKQRKPFQDKVRLAFIGVPPIITDLYPVLEDWQARVVYNETQHQFSMPAATDDLVEQYLSYTYPYGIHQRLAAIEEALSQRQIDGVIHYVQAFCFRQIEDVIVRRRLPVPVLTLEGDEPGPMDARTRLRLESFVEMLQEKQC